jgi:hypothetical protein
MPGDNPSNHGNATSARGRGASSGSLLLSGSESKAKLGLESGSPPSYIGGDVEHGRFSTPTGGLNEAKKKQINK